MKTVLNYHYAQTWRRMALCGFFFFFAFAAVAFGSEPPPVSQDFWVWDLNVMPPGFRKAHALRVSAGSRAYVYVEDKLWKTNVQQDFVSRLSRRLEVAMPDGALNSNMGIVPFEEKVFAPLPKKMRPDDHLVVLFADLGQYKDQQFDGFFNTFDQLTEEEAWSRYQQHSNEMNMIYLNGLRRNSEDYTTGVIAHELQHLLAQAARPANAPDSDSWFSEMLAEGAMLLTGYPSDQPIVDRYAANPGAFSLVTSSYVQYGPQLLFSSYLLDSVQGVPNTAIGALSNMQGDGRKLVETLLGRLTNTPLTFDVIFGNFISYVAGHSVNKSVLPKSWSHEKGIVIPYIKPAFTVHADNASVKGSIAPYAFVFIDLLEELPANAVVEVQRYDDPHVPPLPGSCAGTASVLWKPIGLRRLAVYAVGCEPSLPNDKLQFELKIHPNPAFEP